MLGMSAVTVARKPAEGVDATISRTVRAIIAYRGPASRARVIAAMGVSRSGFYNRLAGDTQWTAAEVKHAADALGVSVATLFEGMKWAPSDSNREPTVSRVRRLRAVA